LGRHLDPKPIEVNPNGVFLITYNEEGGANPERLGASEEEMVRTSDISVMFKISSEIGGLLQATSSEDKARIKSLAADHDKAQQTVMGVTSPAYQQWAKVRSQINRLLN